MSLQALTQDKIADEDTLLSSSYLPNVVYEKLQVGEKELVKLSLSVITFTDISTITTPTYSDISIDYSNDR